jgi:hypothetical protein
MRSILAIALLFLTISTVSSFANTHFNASGPAAGTAGPHTPVHPDSKD